MFERAISQVQFEIEQIERLFESYGDLLEKVQEREPNLIEITALASVLHSFYNGLKTAGKLGDYLGFRHFYRHSYSFFLDWEELEKLVMPLAEIWQRTRDELQRFLDGLRDD